MSELGHRDHHSHAHSDLRREMPGLPDASPLHSITQRSHPAIHTHHDLLVAARAHALTDEFKIPYRQHRPMVERSIAWLVRKGARKVRYRGIARNQIGLAHRCAAINLKRLINLGLDWNTTWTITT